jgi:iron-sulfur cluster repair protein YtfE (RIC family)
MCEHCGCRGVLPIAELMNEHMALMGQAHFVRQQLGIGNHATAMVLLAELVAHLDRHVQREEDGIFRALRAEGEFMDEIDALDGEHRGLTAAVAALDPHSADLAALVTRLLDDLEDHVEREDLGMFPVSVVTLGAKGWAIVDKAHTGSPSFLLDKATKASSPA